MSRAMPHWLMLSLASLSVLLLIVVILIFGCLRVNYQMERGSHHGLHRTTETGTAWINPFGGSEPSLAVIDVHTSGSLPTRIEQDFPEVFCTDLETMITSLEVDSWLPVAWSSYGCGNVFIDAYETNELFRQAVRDAIVTGRLDRHDLLPMTQYCGDAIPPGQSPSDPPGKSLLITLLHDSLPRPTLPMSQSSPSSPSR